MANQLQVSLERQDFMKQQVAMEQQDFIEQQDFMEQQVTSLPNLTLSEEDFL